MRIYRFKSAAIVANCERAASRSSTISARDDVGTWQVGAVFEALVFEPEDVEVECVALTFFRFELVKTSISLFALSPAG